MSANIIYIDESGHTGDLLKSGERFDFSGQPYFVLGAVGPISEEHAADLLNNIVVKHRLRMGEVKSGHLGKRPGVARDLLKALQVAGVPVFVEAVDKVFYVVMQIVNSQVMPSATTSFGTASEWYVRNAFADFLYEYLPDDLLAGFIDACVADTEAATRHSMRCLLGWAETLRDDELVGMDVEVVDTATALADSLSTSLEEFDVLVGRNPDRYRTFLPIPDRGKRDLLYWILPNYSCLTNLYARINQYRYRSVGGIRLVHDEQAQYDQILRDAKRAVESLDNYPGLVVRAADYDFKESADLEFASSATTPGLMIADVIAGHVGRFLRDEAEGKPINPTAWEAFMSTWDSADDGKGPGINLVLPTGAVERLHVEVVRKRLAGQRDQEV